MMLPSTTPTVIQVQPVDPPKRTSEEVGQLIAYGIVLIPALVALFGLFLWWGWNTIADLFPAVPGLGYWQAVALVLGLHTVGVLLVRRPTWKWARR